MAIADKLLQIEPLISSITPAVYGVLSCVEECERVASLLRAEGLHQFADLLASGDTIDKILEEMRTHGTTMYDEKLGTVSAECKAMRAYADRIEAVYRVKGGR